MIFVVVLRDYECLETLAVFGRDSLTDRRGLITAFFHLRSLALDDLPGEVPQDGPAKLRYEAVLLQAGIYKAHMPHAMHVFHLAC